MDQAARTGQANSGQRTPKLHRVVLRTENLTQEQIIARYGRTFGDWTLSEQNTFTEAVTTSHGWTYHNAMAAHAIQ